MYDLPWSKTEKQVARRAFDKAYESECAALLAKVRGMAEIAREPGDLWRMHDFLYERRKEIAEKYDYRYSVLILVFTRLVREGWLKIENLDGLGDDKLAEIERILQFARDRAASKQQASAGD